MRICDGEGCLTIKGPLGADGIGHLEWEKELSLTEAEELLGLCQGVIIDKTRYIVPASPGRRFEVDEFHGENEGLVLAEIELGSAGEEFVHPSWVGEEVSLDRRYFNLYLSMHPYREW